MKPHEPLKFFLNFVFLYFSGPTAEEAPDSQHLPALLPRGRLGLRGAGVRRGRAGGGARGAALLRRPRPRRAAEVEDGGGRGLCQDW